MINITRLSSAAEFVYNNVYIFLKTYMEKLKKDFYDYIHLSFCQFFLLYIGNTLSSDCDKLIFKNYCYKQIS